MVGVRRQLAPVVLWAVLGAGSLVLMVVTGLRWIASGVHAVPAGDDRFSSGHLVVLRALEVASAGLLAVLLTVNVLAPAWRRRPLTFDGWLILSFLLMNFWDPLDNYLAFSFQYNAHFVNVGSWGAQIPGWQSAGGATWVVPVFLVAGAYVWGFYLGARVGCAVMDRVHRRWAEWGGARLFACAWCANGVLVLVCTAVFLRTTSWTNVRTPAALTLWAGHTYAMTLYDPVFMGLAWTVPAALRWHRSRDAAGMSFLEAGIERVPLGARARVVVRFLAVSAFIQLAYIVTYFVPWNVLAQTAPGPRAEPSYFPVPAAHAASSPGR